MRSFSVRFDIDSVTCVRVGLEPLLKIARDLQVAFTFFVVPGQTIDRGLLLRSRASSSAPATQPAPKLGSRRKLGIGGMLETLALNPSLLPKFAKEIARIPAEGHELGLHGGDNHALWQRRLTELTSEEIARTLDAGLATYRRDFPAARGFAAPGFAWTPTALKLLAQRGFAYSGDLPGESPFFPVIQGERIPLLQLPVNIAAPGRIPWIESALARGWPKERMLEEVRGQAEGRDYACFYGHPFVEGRVAEWVGAVVEWARGEGFVIRTLGEVAADWAGRAPDREIG